MSLNERKDKTGRIKEVDLGLSESEQQSLGECRRSISSDADLDDLNDSTLARYLRNNAWQVEPAIAQMKAYLKWRKDSKVDEILKTPDFPCKDLIRTIVPYAYHNTDKEGRPIYIEKTGMIATAAMADQKICPLEDIIHSHIYGVELMQERMYQSSLERGVRVSGICTILDMAGLGFQHRNCLFVLKKCLEFDKQYYPEYLGKLYVINSPWVAPYIFQAVQLFLDEVTKSKIEVISGDPIEFLSQTIAPENLPKEYGGTCTGVTCHHGGMGDHYTRVTGCIDVLDSSNLKAEEISGLDTQEVAYDFEKLVSSSASGTAETFTWYFEVADGYDIDFSVELLPISGVKEADENKRVLIQKVERLKTGKGTFKAPFPNAKILLRWDNNFSYFTSKTIKYTVSCVHDESGKFEDVIASSAAKPTSGANSSSSSAK